MAGEKYKIVEWPFDIDMMRTLASVVTFICSSIFATTDIPAAFDILKPAMPPEVNDVIQWFEDNYIHGRIRRQPQFGDAVWDLSLFPLSLWSVYHLEYHEHKIL